MGDLLQEADAIKAGLTTLRNNVKSLEIQQKQALFAITQEQITKNTQEIQRLTDDTTKLAQKVKGQLDGLRRSADASGDSMRHNLSESLGGKFAEVLHQYQKAQTDYEAKLKAKMAQKVRLVKPDATNEEIDRVVESGEVDKLVRSATLDPGYLRGQAQDAFNYVQARHNDIQQIERSVKELNQLFLDMAILVESDGVMLGHIEDNVNSAVLLTAEGTQKLGSAVKLQRKSRKKMYIIILICVAVVVVIAVLGGALGSIKK